MIEYSRRDEYLQANASRIKEITNQADYLIANHWDVMELARTHEQESVAFTRGVITPEDMANYYGEPATSKEMLQRAELENKKFTALANMSLDGELTRAAMRQIVAHPDTADDYLSGLRFDNATWTRTVIGAINSSESTTCDIRLTHIKNAEEVGDIRAYNMTCTDEFITRRLAVLYENDTLVSVDATVEATDDEFTNYCVIVGLYSDVEGVLRGDFKDEEDLEHVLYNASAPHLGTKEEADVLALIPDIRERAIAAKNSAEYISVPQDNLPEIIMLQQFLRYLNPYPLG